VSDARGRFTFGGVIAGEYVVVARKRGFYDGAFGKRRASGDPLPVTVVPGQAMSDMAIELFRSGVITGSIRDEANEPVIGVPVVAVRRFFSGGTWQYLPTGTVLTDDQGMYRVFGLEPGEYFVATPTTQLNVDVPDDTIIGPALPYAVDQDEAYPSLFYASTRYSTLALPVLLGSGETRYAINFQWAPVPARAVSGQLEGDLARIANQLVKLVPRAGGELGLAHEVAATVTDMDGRFRFERVPAGEYSLEAGGAYGPPRLIDVIPATPVPAADIYYGRATITVIDEDLKDLGVRMQRGYAVNGVIESPRAPVPQRISIALVPAAPGLSRATAPVVTGGRFTSVPVIPGDYYVRVTGLPPGWYLKSITSDDGDLLDEPGRFGELNSPGVVISLTDRPTTITGSVRDSRMQPASGATVVVIPASSPVRWSPNRSRQTRASMNGQFAISGLPSGDYLIVAFDDAVAEGFQDEHMLSQLRTLATRVSLRDEETRTIHLRLSNVKR
jgi:hypothetical protein